MIEIWVNDELVDLTPETIVALTRQANDVADMSSRQSDFTNQFALPKTRNNLAIFNLLGGVNSPTGVPYVQPTCKIVSEGVEIVSNGVIIVESVTTEINISVLGGIADFFTTIKDKSIKDLNLSAYDIQWTLANWAARLGQTSGVLWPVIDWGTFDASNNTPLTSDPGRYLDVRDQTPAIYLYHIIEAIITEAGFSSTTFFTLLDDYTAKYTRYKKIMLPYTAIRPGTTTLAKVHFDVRNLYYGVFKDVGVGATTYIPFGNSGHGDNVDEYGQWIDLGSGRYGWIIQSTGWYEVNVELDMYFDDTWANVVFNLQDQRGNIYNTVTEGGAAGDAQVDLSGRYYFEEGNIIEVEVNMPNDANTYTVYFNGTDNGWQGSYISDYSCKFDLLDSEIPICGFGWDLECAINLPDVRQVDIMKLVAQMFCGIYIVDPVTKIVDLIPFDEILRKKDNAPDWSDKLDLSEPASMRFSYGNYAQRNYLKYQDLDDDTTGFANGYFDIPDETLPAETTLLQSEFSPMKMKTVLNLVDGVTSVKVCTKKLLSINKGHFITHLIDNNKYWSNDGANWTLHQTAHNGSLVWYWKATNTSGANAETDRSLRDSEEVVPLLIMIHIDDVDQILRVHTGDLDSYSGYDEDIPMAYFQSPDHIALDSIDWQSLIDAYYGALVNALTNAKVINRLFNLNSLDVANADLTTPVWIKYFSSYFYVNKISEFISGQLTEVELLKLK